MEGLLGGSGEKRNTVTVMRTPCTGGELKHVDVVKCNFRQARGSDGQEDDDSIQPHTTTTTLETPHTQHTNYTQHANPLISISLPQPFHPHPLWPHPIRFACPPFSRLTSSKPASTYYHHTILHCDISSSARRRIQQLLPRNTFAARTHPLTGYNRTSHYTDEKTDRKAHSWHIHGSGVIAMSECQASYVHGMQCFFFVSL